ncbi:MAG: S8 family serine peptidase, partial [Candidatus Dormiibacterota bacterium]
MTVARVLGVALGMLLPLSLAVPARAASVAGSVQASRLTPEQIAQLSAQANEKSIIVLKNQHPELPPVPSNTTRRAQAVQSDQAPITGELQQLRSPNLHSFQIVNAVGATISQAEVSRLRTNPVVEAVVPDAERTVLPVTDNAATPAAPATPGPSSSTQPEQVCPPNPQVPLVEPEALQLLHVQNQTGDTSPAAHDIVDGTGVKVGIIADGLDVNNPDLTRNGKSIVYDFQDFSGDGPGAPTDSREAFLDAGSIAAQGKETYDLSKFVNPAHPLPAGCNIKIEGVAPGATLAIMNVFGGNAFTYDSNLLMGIDHAVSVDKVDVLNESFGGSGYPDDSVDPVKVANENAVAAGVTVVASTGDAGPTSTIGTPATDPGIIAAGGSTALQIVRELNGDGSPVVAGGWLSDNMSDIGSSGTSQYGPRTVDVVAPADRDWTLCSTDIAKYTGCADLYDNHLATLPIWAAGGTSVSAPLTSGTAALVIEAYAKTHHGQHPTPALVKQIIMGSATDLEAPANHQGAGLVNALKAVQTAESLTDGNGSPKAIGDGLVASRPSLSTVASAGSSASFTEQVTNTSPKAVTVTPQLAALNASPQTNDTGTAQLGAGDATFVDASGLTDRYQINQFTVPQGTDYLTADIGWNAQKEAGTGVLVSLFDPAGRFANYSP